MPILKVISEKYFNKNQLLDFKSTIANILNVESNKVWVFHESVQFDNENNVIFELSWNEDRNINKFDLKNNFTQFLLNSGINRDDFLLKLIPIKAENLSTPFVNSTFDLKWIPIATIFNDIENKKEDFWSETVSEIKLNKNIYDSSVLKVLEEFSHIDVYFYFDQSFKKNVNFVRRPRGREDLPEIGILTQRAKNRVNSLGHTTCQLLEVKDDSLLVKGLDAFNNSPVIDIKPHFQGRFNEIKQPLWVKMLMSNYWKK